MRHIMSKDPHKDELKKAWRERRRQELAASIHMPLQDLRDLFVPLDQEAPAGCNHILRVTAEFLQKRGLETESIIPWLREHGGYCDCEVLANVEDEFTEILGQ